MISVNHTDKGWTRCYIYGRLCLVYISTVNDSRLENINQFIVFILTIMIQFIS